MNRIDIYINIVCKSQKSASYIFCIRAYITLYFLSVYFLSLLINFKTHEEIDLQFFFFLSIEFSIVCHAESHGVAMELTNNDDGFLKILLTLFFLKLPKISTPNFLFLQPFLNLYLLILYFRCIFMKR